MSEQEIIGRIRLLTKHEEVGQLSSGLVGSGTELENQLREVLWPVALFVCKLNKALTLPIPDDRVWSEFSESHTTYTSDAPGRSQSSFPGQSEYGHDTPNQQNYSWTRIFATVDTLWLEWLE